MCGRSNTTLLANSFRESAARTPLHLSAMKVAGLVLLNPWRASSTNVDQADQGRLSRSEAAACEGGVRDEGVGSR